MLKNETCIVCPNGCDLSVEIQDGKVLSVSGNRCKRGVTWVKQEVTDSHRVVTSSVVVRGGVMPLCSVRTSDPVPKDRIPDVMAVIRTIVRDAPVSAGDVLVTDLLGLGVSLIATRNVPRNKQ
jgi:CxxC motif-containing protein